MRTVQFHYTEFGDKTFHIVELTVPGVTVDLGGETDTTINIGGNQDTRCQ